MGFVKINRWVKGVLEQIQHEFATIKEALHFAHKDTRSNIDQTIKVYNAEGEIVEATNTNTDTYA